MPGGSKAPKAPSSRRPTPRLPTRAVAGVGGGAPSAALAGAREEAGEPGGSPAGALALGGRAGQPGAALVGAREEAGEPGDSPAGGLVLGGRAGQPGAALVGAREEAGEPGGSPAGALVLGGRSCPAEMAARTAVCRGAGVAPGCRCDAVRWGLGAAAARRGRRAARSSPTEWPTPPSAWTVRRPFRGCCAPARRTSRCSPPARPPPWPRPAAPSREGASR